MSSHMDQLRAYEADAAISGGTVVAARAERERLESPKGRRSVKTTEDSPTEGTSGGSDPAPPAPARSKRRR